MLPIIFVVPIIQLVVLAYAATFEIKNIDICLIDNDLSSTSRALAAKFEGSPFFNLTFSAQSFEKAEELLIKEKADIILNIPAGFEKKLVRENMSTLQIVINAINGTVAGISQAYCMQILTDFNRQVIVDWHGVSQTNMIKQINIQSSFWYNPELNYQIYMVPGILVILVTLIGMFLSGLNLVREKEIGTTEQINVTPIKKYQFIIGKLLPFWIIAIGELAFGLTIGKILFDIPIVGSLITLFTIAAVYLLVVLGLGLFVSTLVDTQQQAMFVAFFFMLIFILMSGLFTSLDSMPDWAQTFNRINPMAYLVKALRMILLKGSTLANITTELINLSIYAVIILSLAIWRYRKVT